MENERELLELAANAAGIPRYWNDGLEPYSSGQGFIVQNRIWNPLTDDGDALRLAVKLRISIMLAETTTDKSECCFFDGSNWSYFENDGISEADAATRRAIVRAASEIGRAMQSDKR